MLFGGSPCTSFSIGGKLQNFEADSGKLFFEYVKALEKTNPTYFLLENVVMKQEWQDVISGYLGVKPTMINSSLLSAQSRKRLYWTNIPFNKDIPDKGILLSDIIHENTDNVGIEEFIVSTDRAVTILDWALESRKLALIGGKDSAANRVYNINGKSVTLTGESGGGAAKMGQYLIQHPPRGYNSGSFITTDSKMRTITGSNFQQNNFMLMNSYIRKLSPVECERLQTLPDNYTEGITKTQRYKCLGNGWTVDVISHILNGIMHPAM